MRNDGGKVRRRRRKGRKGRCQLSADRFFFTPWPLMAHRPWTMDNGQSRTESARQGEPHPHATFDAYRWRTGAYVIAPCRQGVALWYYKIGSERSVVCVSHTC
eukprot:scaffold207644_cov36-Tisochrysis_lutea.AAC.2